MLVLPNEMFVHQPISPINFRLGPIVPFFDEPIREKPSVAYLKTADPNLTAFEFPNFVLHFLELFAILDPPVIRQLPKKNIQLAWSPADSPLMKSSAGHDPRWRRTAFNGPLGASRNDLSLGCSAHGSLVIAKLSVKSTRDASMWDYAGCLT